MLQTSRRQFGALEEHNRNALSDQVTGLDNRLRPRDRHRRGRRSTRAIAACCCSSTSTGCRPTTTASATPPATSWCAGSPRRWSSRRRRSGGTAYRIDDSRLALLVPAGDSRLGEIVLAATASLHDEGRDLLIGRAYGEVAIPDEATDPEIAMQIAGQRLTAHNQRQHRSARRQAHAVLMAVLAARRPELRDHLRVVAYRAISLGRRLGLGREEIDDVALAAELQDVGLLAVPEAVLEKEGRADRGGDRADPQPADRRRADHRRGAGTGPGRRAWSAPAPSTSTAAASPTASPARRSRSAPGSSPSPSPTRR